MAGSATNQKVLAIVLQAIDKFSPVLRAAQTIIAGFGKATAFAFRLALLPVTIFHRAIQALLSPIGLLRAALTFLAARGFVRFITASAEAADAIDKLSITTGFSVTTLQRLKFVGEVAGTSIDSLATSVLRMHRSIADAADGSGEARQAIARLGLSAEKLKALAPEEQFAAIRDAIAGIANHSDRVQAVFDVFGKGATDLLRLFALTPAQFGNLSKTMQAFILSPAQVSAAVAFKDAWETLGIALQALRNNVAIAFMPALERGITALTEFVANHLPALRDGAAAVARNVEFAARAAFEFVGMFRTLLQDRGATKILGDMMGIAGDLFLNVLGSTLKAATGIVVSWLGVLIEPAAILATSIGERIGQKLTEGFDRALLKDLQSEWNGMMQQFEAGGGLKMPPLLVDDWIKKLKPLEEQIMTLTLKLEQPNEQFKHVFAQAAQDAMTAFDDHFSGFSAAGSGFITEISRHIDTATAGMSLLADKHPAIAQYIDTLKTIKAEIEGCATAVETVGQNAATAGTKVNAFWAGFASAASDTWDRLKDAGAAGQELFNGMFGAFNSGIDSMIDSAIAGTLSISQAFKDMGKEILSVIAKIFARQIAMAAVGMLFPGLGIGGLAFGSFAGGADFVTTRPTMMMVGDNPGGRERVTVTPLSGRGRSRVSPNSGMIHMAGGGTVETGGGPGGGGGQPIIVNIHIDSAIDTKDFQQRLAQPEVKRQIGTTVQQAIETQTSMRRSISKAARTSL